MVKFFRYLIQFLSTRCKDGQISKVYNLANVLERSDFTSTFDLTCMWFLNSQALNRYPTPGQHYKTRHMFRIMYFKLKTHYNLGFLALELPQASLPLNSKPGAIPLFWSEVKNENSCNIVSLITCRRVDKSKIYLYRPFQTKRGFLLFLFFIFHLRC